MMTAAVPLLLLVVIIFLLWRQQSQRDFHVVQHFAYDLVFEESSVFRGGPGLPYVAAERGHLLHGASQSFSDFGAAKTFFERSEGARGEGIQVGIQQEN